MKRFKTFFSTLKGKINRLLTIDKKYFPIFSVVVLCVLGAFFLVRYFQTKPLHDAQVISTDIQTIARILHIIDESCSILSVKNERSPIDFLTVEKFVSSEIGGLNLAYPTYWKGPYLKDNPIIEGISYELVKAKDGYFILPGNGFRLPNGLVMGKDVVITLKTEVLPMLRHRGPLYYGNIPLGKKIEFIIGDWPPPKEERKKVSDLNKSIREFGEAIPFTMKRCDSVHKKT